MSLSIRMARGGNKKRPFFRIVVQERSAPRDGRFIERLGSYNPLLADNKSQIDKERAQYWMDVGAQPSQRVSRLLELHSIQHARIKPPLTKKRKPKSAPPEKKPTTQESPTEKVAKNTATENKETPTVTSEVTPEVKSEVTSDSKDSSVAQSKATNPEKKSQTSGDTDTAENPPNDSTNSPT